MPPDVLKCYEVLDIPPGSSPDAVRKAYVSLCQVWHPARFQSNPILLQRAQTKMQQVEEAYQAIRAFLPELQGLVNPADSREATPRIDRGIDVITETGRERYILGVVLLLTVFGLGITALIIYWRGQAVGGLPTH